MKVQLVVTIDPTTGSVEVEGPIDNLLVCFGMLEMAKDSLRANAAAKARAVQMPGQNEVLTFGKRP